MLDIAKKFPDANKQHYVDAVQKFRLPYWDYYRPRAKKKVWFRGVKPNDITSFPFDFSIPQVFTVTKLMVRTPSKNELTPIDNPLTSFTFPEDGSKWAIDTSDWNSIAVSQS